MFGVFRHIAHRECTNDGVQIVVHIPTLVIWRERKTQSTFSNHSSDATLALCNQWLCVGIGMTKDQQSGQLEHVHNINRNDIKMRSQCALGDDVCRLKG